MASRANDAVSPGFHMPAGTPGKAIGYCTTHGIRCRNLLRSTFAAMRLVLAPILPRCQEPLFFIRRAMPLTASHDRFAGRKKASHLKSRPKWQGMTGLQIGRLPFAGNAPLHGGLRRFCKKLWRPTTVLQKRSVRIACKTVLPRHKGLQNRHRPPFCPGKLVLGSYLFCKSVIACHLRPGKRTAWAMRLADSTPRASKGARAARVRVCKGENGEHR